MELDNIKLQTTWNDAAGSINSNFLKLKSSAEQSNSTVQTLSERVAELEKTAISGGGGGGSSGEGDKNYYFTQSSPSEEWMIEHGLGKYPSVTVVSSAGEEIYCDKTFLSMNKVVLNFGTAISGAAFLN